MKGTIAKGLSFLDIGLLIGFREICVYLLDIPSGAIADLHGRRRSMILSFSAYILSFSLFALAGALPLLFCGKSPHEAEKRAKEVLSVVGLADRVTHKPDELSGGQQQRVAVARALACEPAIILADEPTANLDLDTGGEIIDLLHRLCKEFGVTVICATHDHEMLAKSDRMLWIADGAVDRLERRQDVDIRVGTVEDA